MLEALFQDIHFAVRLLRKAPGFTAVAILTLALGVGANIAIFAVINSVLLKPLAYRDSDHLMILTETASGIPEPSELSYLNYEDWRDQNHSFNEMSIFRDPQFLNLMTTDGPKIITSRMVSASFFATLGVAPMIGRDFRSDDDRPGTAPTLILSYGAWQRYFGGDPLIVGKSLSISDANYTVIGVTPGEFAFYSNPDVYMPIGLARQRLTSAREYRAGLNAVGRLKSGVSRAQAQAEIEEIAERLAYLYPQANTGRGASVVPIFKDVVGDVGSTLYLLFGAVGFLLLIACVNIANLLLARGSARQKEIAIRTALGAGSWRVGRQLVTESLLLGIAGGIAGVVIAALGTRALVAAVPGSLPRAESIGVDWRVLAFALAISILTGVVFGLAPAIQGLRADVKDRLQEGGYGSTSGSRVIQNVLGVTEVALALILLTGAGLVLRSTLKLIGVDPGFDPRDVLIFKISAPPREFASGEAVLNFYRQLEEKLRAIPSVEAASMAMGDLPMQGGPHFPFYVAERPKPSLAAMIQGLGYINDPDYLRTMHIRLLRGRYFDSHDVFTSPPVIVVDDTLVKVVFEGENPIGKHLVLAMPGFDQPREIIGIVNHVKHWGLDMDEHAPVQSQFYLPAGQLPPEVYSGAPQGLMMVMRSGLPPSALIPQVQNAVFQLDRNLPVYRATTMSDIVMASISARRFAALLLGLFAAVAFILCAIGIYGVMAYSVAQRRYEFGVRTVLGAQTRDITRIVVGQGAKLCVAGIMIGLVASFALTRFITSLLYGVSAADPFTLATVALMLLVVALAGSYIPARPALFVDPLAALGGGRTETQYPSYTNRRSNRPLRRFSSISSETVMVIETCELTKTYRSLRQKAIPALDAVSLSVGRGTIFGLIGQNGAGKTTLVKILMGLSTATAGSARLLGRSAGDPTTRRLVGYLPEQMRLPDFFKATDFLHYMGRLNEVDSATLKQRIPDLLEKVGLSGVAKPLKAYSKGMQQRLGLAQALLSDPEVLFLDEPTDGLDPLGRRDVRNLLVDLRASGKTILLNSHLLSEVELVCDHIVILNKGKIACSATPREFTRGTGEYRVRVAAVDYAIRAAVAATMCPGDWQGTSFRCQPRDGAQLNAVIDKLRGVHAEIELVEPVKFSLEQFFVNIVEQDSKC
jgi:predicted permease